MTKLASSLPDGDANGLVAIGRALVDRPHDMHAIVTLVDCKKTTTDNDTGEVVPTARIRRIEVITGDDISLAERIMRRALEHRTGQTVLPLDLEDELREAFGQMRVDPDTGEISADGE